MQLDISTKHQTKQVANHLLFWAFSLLFLTIIIHYKYDSSSYRNSFITSAAILPFHILYFYLINSFVITKYLKKGYDHKIVVLAIIICILITLLYRLNEIMVIDNYIANISINRDKVRPSYLNETFSNQFSDMVRFISAFEKINLIVWPAVAIKFFKGKYKRQQLALETELSFLKATIHPHFLFNTLNNLYALTLKQSVSSSTVVIGLSEILRYMLRESSTENVKLIRDIEILKNYIILEEIRYGDRLNLELNIKGDLENYYIPPLLMLPLVENAFKHGASEMLRNAWIKIDIEVENSTKLIFKVANSRPIQKNICSEIHFEKIGLSNVRKRLDFHYRDWYQLNVYSEGEIFLVTLEIDMDNNNTNNYKTDHNDLQKTA